MPSLHDIRLAAEARRSRILGHCCTAAIVFLITMAMLAGCKSVDRSIQYQDRAELVRCQNQDAGWVQACHHVQAVQADYQQPSISTLGGQQ